MKKSEYERFIKDVCKISPGRVMQDVSMSRHTTIAVGGPAKIFVEPQSVGAVLDLVKLARRRKLDYMVIGKGSNLLVRDGGYHGMVIKIASNLSKIRINKRTALAESGASFSLLAKKVTQLGRPGLEFALGIPGTVGGAVRMNAGAFGWDVSGVLQRVKLVDEKGRVSVFKSGDLDFSYRRSHFPRNAIVLSATFRCPPGALNRETLKKSRGRHKTQPLDCKSFGSTFVNPPGGFAGRLIEACGLKGVREGGAMVSRKHANFILNVGKDTKASDVEALIRLIRREVKKKFGIALKPEVVIVGN